MSANVILLSFQFWVDTATHNVGCVIRSSSLESGGVKTWLKFGEAICCVGTGKTSCRARRVWQGWLLLLPFYSFFLSPRLPPFSFLLPSPTHLQPLYPHPCLCSCSHLFLLFHTLHGFSHFFFEKVKCSGNVQRNWIVLLAVLCKFP